MNAVILLALALLAGVLTVNGDEALIRTTCSKTEQPDLCTATLLANSTSRTQDVKGLATTVAVADYSAVREAVNYLIEAHSNAPIGALETALSDCIVSYETASIFLQNATACLGAGKISDAIEAMMDAAREPVACLERFSDAKLPYPPELEGRQKKVVGLSRVAVQIAQLV